MTNTADYRHLEPIHLLYGPDLAIAICKEVPPDAGEAQTFRHLINSDLHYRRAIFWYSANRNLSTAEYPAMTAPALVDIHSCGLEPDAIATALKIAAAIADSASFCHHPLVFLDLINAHLPGHFGALAAPPPPRITAATITRNDVIRAFVADPEATLDGFETTPIDPATVPEAEGGTKPSPAKAVLSKP